MVNADLLKQWEGKAVVRNSLGKELQHLLRKKKVPFHKANEYLRHLAATNNTSMPCRPTVGTSTGEEREAKCPVSRGDLDLSPAGEQMPETVSGTEKDSCTEAALGSPCPATAPVGSPLKTSGAMTDEDIVKLRPCEKTRVSRMKERSLNEMDEKSVLRGLTWP